MVKTNCSDSCEKNTVHLCIIFNIFADIFCINMLKELYALAENSNNNGTA